VVAISIVNEAEHWSQAGFCHLAALWAVTYNS
jgi:hypothetical protein